MTRNSKAKFRRCSLRKNSSLSRTSLPRVVNPIITRNGYILDGHTRYRILKKHGFIKFEAEEIQLANKYEALAWICKNQLGRRNLSPERKKFLLEQIFTIDKSRIERFMGYASKAEMLRIDMALLVSLALNVLSENRSE